MLKHFVAGAAIAAASLVSLSAHAQQKVDFILNWG